MTLDDLAAGLSEAPEATAPWLLPRCLAAERGVVRLSCHHHPPGKAALSGRGLDLWAEGFPAGSGWRSLKARRHTVDPFPARGCAA